MIKPIQMWFRNGCVPSKSGNNEPILFSEFTFIKADQQKEENNSRKRPFYNWRKMRATPLFDWKVKTEKIEKLSKSLETCVLKIDFAATLTDNNF